MMFGCRWNRKSRRNCRRAVKSQAMFWFIIILVLLNTCVLATEHYNQPEWLEHFQEIANMFFVVLFTVEMLLKMYALGFQVTTQSRTQLELQMINGGVVQLRRRPLPQRLRRESKLKISVG